MCLTLGDCFQMSLFQKMATFSFQTGIMSPLFSSIDCHCLMCFCLGRERERQRKRERGKGRERDGKRKIYIKRERERDRQREREIKRERERETETERESNVAVKCVLHAKVFRVYHVLRLDNEEFSRYQIILSIYVGYSL